MKPKIEEPHQPPNVDTEVVTFGVYHSLKQARKDALEATQRAIKNTKETTKGFKKPGEGLSDLFNLQCSK